MTMSNKSSIRSSPLSTLLLILATPNSCLAFVVPSNAPLERRGPIYPSADCTSANSKISGRRKQPARLLGPLSAFAVDLSTAASALDEFYRTAPLQSAFLTCGVKASVADVVAQRMDDDTGADDGDGEGEYAPAGIVADDDAEDVGSFSPLRNLAFVLYGGFYCGCAQEIIFNEVYPRIFGTGTAPLTILSEVMFDTFLVAPLVCLPIAYFTKAIVFNYSLREGLERYVKDVQLRGLLTKYWALWTPVQTLTFSVVPEHLRVAWVALVSFFWFIILSAVSDDGGAADAGETIRES